MVKLLNLDVQQSIIDYVEERIRLHEAQGAEVIQMSFYKDGEAQYINKVIESYSLVECKPRLDSGLLERIYVKGLGYLYG